MRSFHQVSVSRACLVRGRPCHASYRRGKSSSAAVVDYEDDPRDGSSSLGSLSVSAALPQQQQEQQGPASGNPDPIYVAATKEHVGKTSTSMALLSGLQKRFHKVGFMKPVGQKSLRVQTDDGDWINIDKDAVLVKEHFGLDHLDYRHTSPVLIPQGYTKDYLDGDRKSVV